jgi:hypothetical protein
VIGSTTGGSADDEMIRRGAMIRRYINRGNNLAVIMRTDVKQSNTDDELTLIQRYNQDQRLSNRDNGDKKNKIRDLIEGTGNPDERELFETLNGANCRLFFLTKANSTEVVKDMLRSHCGK